MYPSCFGTIWGSGRPGNRSGEDIYCYLSISWLGWVILGCGPKPITNGTFDRLMRHKGINLATFTAKSKNINVGSSSLMSLTLLQLTICPDRSVVSCGRPPRSARLPSLTPWPWWKEVHGEIDSRHSDVVRG